MLLTIEFSPQEEIRLRAAALVRGLELPDLAHELVIEQLQEALETVSDFAPVISAKSQAAIAMLRSWIEQGESASDEEAEAADAEADELLRNLNANRAAVGDRSL